MQQFDQNPRPLNARERFMRFKYLSFCVMSVIATLIVSAFYARQSYQLKNLKTGIDSSFSRLNLVDYRVDEDGDTIKLNHTEKSKIVLGEFKDYLDMYDAIEELKSNNIRYEMALDYYNDPEMHEELRNRGKDFNSRYTPSEREEIVKKIKIDASALNALCAYSFALDSYRVINPSAVKEIEEFLYFTE